MTDVHLMNRLCAVLTAGFTALVVVLVDFANYAGGQSDPFVQYLPGLIYVMYLLHDEIKAVKAVDDDVAETDAEPEVSA